MEDAVPVNVIRKAAPGWERIESDFYATPQPLANEIVARIPEFAPRFAGPLARIIEPSAGNGNFVRALRASAFCRHITAVETRAEEEMNLSLAGADVTLIADWEDVAESLATEPSLIIGNPPFIRAEQHVRSALVSFPEGSVTAFLLRLSFLCGKDRTKRLRKLKMMGYGGLKFLIPIQERPSFANDGGTDGSEYGVFVFENGFTGNWTGLEHIQWKGNLP